MPTPIRTPINDDDLTFALEVMRVMRDIAARQPKVQLDEGVIECPKCKGTYRYAYMRGPQGSELQQNHVGACDTAGCIRLIYVLTRNFDPAVDKPAQPKGSKK